MIVRFKEGPYLMRTQIFAIPTSNSETHPHTHDAGGDAEGGEGGAQAASEAAGGPKDAGIKEDAAG